MKASSLLKLSTLGLSSEQMTVVLAVLAEELAPLDERRERDRLRKAGGKSKDVPQNIGGNSAENPRIARGIDKPNLQTVDNTGITPLNPPPPQNALAVVPREPPVQYPEGFEEFWAAYPPRAGSRDKISAVRAYRAALKRASPSQIIAGAKAYHSYIAAAGKLKTEFIRQARTWLNGNGWEENYEHNSPRFGSRSNLGGIIDLAAE